jgi:hypothetical protein
MAHELRCEHCSVYLGTIEKGKVKNKSVQLCEHCWTKASAAMAMAETARNSSMPPFFKDLFGKRV